MSMAQADAPPAGGGTADLDIRPIRLAKRSDDVVA